MATTPAVGATGVRVTVDPGTGVGTVTGTQVYLDGTVPPLSPVLLRPDQITYGVAEVPSLLGQIATRVTANGNAATVGDLGQIVAFVQALLTTPDAPKTPASPTVFTPPDLTL